MWLLLGPILLVGAFSILLPWMAGAGKRPPDDGWRGVFYSNPDDPALLVPKRYGIGYTLNFGNRWSWVVLAFVLLLVAVPVILSAVMMRRLPR